MLDVAIVSCLLTFHPKLAAQMLLFVVVLIHPQLALSSPGSVPHGEGQHEGHTAGWSVHSGFPMKGNLGKIS